MHLNLDYIKLKPKMSDIKLKDNTALQEIKIEIGYFGEIIDNIGEMFLRKINHSHDIRMADLYAMLGPEYQELGIYMFGTTNDISPQFNKYLLINDLDVFDKNVLIVDRIILKQDYRNQAIGLFAIKKVIDVLSGGCGVVAIRPFPLQYSRGVNSENIVDATNAKNKLITHFNKIGFLPLGKTGWMIITPFNKQQYMDLDSLIKLHSMNPELKPLMDQFEKDDPFDTLL